MTTMKWIKNQPMESILAKIVALQIIKYGDDISENVIDYFYNTIPLLYFDEIIEYFKNVIGWRISTWQEITEEHYLHSWIYENEQLIVHHIINELFSTKEKKCGTKNLFHMKCIYPNITTSERCIP